MLIPKYDVVFCVFRMVPMVPVSHKSHSVVFHHIHMYDQFGFEKTNRGFVGNGLVS